MKENEMSKLFIDDLTQRIGQARFHVSEGRGEVCRRELEALERDIAATREEKAPGVAGELIEITTFPEQDDFGEGTTSPTEDVVQPDGEPPMPGGVA